MDKRHRSPNICSKENEVLIRLIEKYKHIIENKKTDSITNEEKSKTWDIISKEFNATSPMLIPRSADCITKFWKNEKKKYRDMVAAERRHHVETGGGPPLKKCKDDYGEIVMSIVNKKTMYGLGNHFDSDNVLVNHNELKESEDISELSPEEDFEEIHLFVENEENTTERPCDSGPSTNTQLNKDTLWGRYTPSDLRKPISEPLATEIKKKIQTNTPSRRRPAFPIRTLSSSTVAQSYEQLLVKRLAIADYQMEVLKENIKQQEVEHKLQVKALELDILIKEETFKQLKK